MVPPSISLLEVEHHASGTGLDLTHNIIKGAVLKPFVLLIMTSVLYTTSGFSLSALCSLSLGFWARRLGLHFTRPESHACHSAIV
jgi:hypothetical protein